MEQWKQYLGKQWSPFFQCEVCCSTRVHTHTCMHTHTHMHTLTCTCTYTCAVEVLEQMKHKRDSLMPSPFHQTNFLAESQIHRYKVMLVLMIQPHSRLNFETYYDVIMYKCIDVNPAVPCSSILWYMHTCTHNYRDYAST